MFARLYQFSVDPDRTKEVEALADTASEIMKKQAGFKSVTFYADYETGECGSFSVWQTREDLEAFVAADFPELKNVAGNLFKGPSTSSIIKVYEPAGA